MMGHLFADLLVSWYPNVPQVIDYESWSLSHLDNIQHPNRRWYERRDGWEGNKWQNIQIRKSLACSDEVIGDNSSRSKQGRMRSTNKRTRILRYSYFRILIPYSHSPIMPQLSKQPPRFLIVSISLPHNCNLSIQLRIVPPDADINHHAGDEDENRSSGSIIERRRVIRAFGGGGSRVETRIRNVRRFERMERG